jgi:DNA ligase (NAD+)
MKFYNYFVSLSKNKITEDIVKKNINDLANAINYYSKKYYKENISEIKDNKFDYLFLLLKNWEKKYPKYKSSNSPTQKIYKAISSTFKKEKHLEKMISLDNVFNEEELIEWENRLKKNLLKKEINLEEINDDIYIVEPKFDGLGISCVYENKILKTALTRGDGDYGENILENAKTISDIKKNIETDFETFEIRGEVVMKKSEFKTLNENLKKNDKKLFSNPRNASSGSLRQLDPNITKQRNLSVFFYESPLKNVQKQFENYNNLLEFFKQKNISHFKSYYKCNNLKSVINAINEIKNLKNNLDYEIDGAVIKINSYKLRNILGSTSHHPRWAIAYKYPSLKVTTKIISVEWQTGRTGVVTPVAVLEPVLINGVIVSKATLHNYDYIEKKDLKVGDIVILERSGEVIPKILSVIKEKRSGEEKPIFMPNKCLECLSTLVKNEDKVALKCINQKCKKNRIEKLIHFTSKKGMNILGLGKEVAKSLIEKEIIKNPSDLYFLTEEDLKKLENFKEKSINNLLSEINKSKNIEFWKVIYSLGIDFVGEKISKIITQKYNSFNEIKNIKIEDLENIHEIGNKIAISFVNYFKNEEHQKIIERLEKVLNIYSEEINEKQKVFFTNKTFVITGKLTNFTRDELAKKIENNGGKISSAISKNTDCLIYGEKAGSKLKKAKDLNTKLLTEDEILKELL